MLEKNILEELGLDSLPSEKQEEALMNIGRIIYQGVLIRVMERLSEPDKDALEKLLAEKANDEQALLSFLKSRINDLDKIIEEEVDKFKSESREILGNS